MGRVVKGMMEEPLVNGEAGNEDWVRGPAMGRMVKNPEEELREGVADKDFIQSEEMVGTLMAGTSHADLLSDLAEANQVRAS